MNNRELYQAISDLIEDTSQVISSLEDARVAKLLRRSLVLMHQLMEVQNAAK